jgi:hypothetical protein
MDAIKEGMLASAKAAEAAARMGERLFCQNTEDAFEKVISHIEHAIKEGYFKKEYLENGK